MPQRVLAPSTRSERTPRISPDGEQVVFSSNRAGEHLQMWVCDSDGANPRQITSFADRVAMSPRWSPDGRIIAFDSYVEGNWQTFVVNADGGQARQITSGNYWNSRPAWSRDGKSLYFCSTRDGMAIFKIPLEGGEAVRLTNTPAIDPFESHDGRWLYFTRENRIWKVRAAGGTEEIVSKEIDLFAGQVWSLDQQDNIYWFERDEEAGQWVVRKLDPQGEISNVAFMDRPPLGRAGLNVAPDGTWFVYAQDDQTQSDLMLIENFQ